MVFLGVVVEDPSLYVVIPLLMTICFLINVLACFIIRFFRLNNQGALDQTAKIIMSVVPGTNFTSSLPSQPR